MSIPSVKRVKLFGVEIAVPLAAPLSPTAVTAPSPSPSTSSSRETGSTLPPAPSLRDLANHAQGTSLVASASTQSESDVKRAENDNLPTSGKSDSQLRGKPDASSQPKQEQQPAVKERKAGSSAPRMIKIPKSLTSSRTSFVLGNPESGLDQKLDSALSSPVASPTPQPKQPIAARLSRPEPSSSQPIAARLSRPEASPSPAPSSPAPHFPLSKKRCRFYTSKQGCRYGNECRNIHEDVRPVHRHDQAAPTRVVDGPPSRKRRERDVEFAHAAPYSPAAYPDSDDFSPQRSDDERPAYRTDPRELRYDQPDDAGADFGGGRYSARAARPEYPVPLTLATGIEYAYHSVAGAPPYYDDYESRRTPPPVDSYYGRPAPAYDLYGGY